jgi:hypothetical protein
MVKLAVGILLTWELLRASCWSVAHRCAGGAPADHSRDRQGCAQADGSGPGADTHTDIPDAGRGAKVREQARAGAAAGTCSKRMYISQPLIKLAA